MTARPALRQQDNSGYRYARKVLRINRARFVETDPQDMRDECMDRLRTEVHLQGYRVKDVDVSFVDRDPDHPSHRDDDAVWALVEAIIV